MFSKELQELDENTVQYMIDEMQDQIEEKDKQIEQGIQLYLSLCQAQGVSREIAIKGLMQTYQLSEGQIESQWEQFCDI